MGNEIGRVFAALHRDHGVDLRLGSGVREVIGHDGRVVAVVTTDGDEIVADTVVAGIGARPVVDLAVAAGLDLDDGVAVDSALRTSDPDIFAAGDIASIDHPLIEGRVRVEHWSNALDSGPAAARSMLGQDVSYDRLPYFFTDQYDLGMEYIGYAPPGIYDTVTLRGDVDGRVFQAFWLRDGQARAGMHVNMWDDGIAPIEELVRSGRFRWIGGGRHLTATTHVDNTVEGLWLGATKARTILRVVLPAATGSVITGIMLALARIAGETAPLLFTAFNNRFWMEGLDRPTATIPVNIYAYAISPFPEWHDQAWAGAFVLLVIVLVSNVIARTLWARRARFMRGG
jgi:hypothetical protein